MRADGGILTAEDLAGYQVKVRRPVAGSYRGHTLLSVPPASSGGAHLVQLLNILENFDLRASGCGLRRLPAPLGGSAQAGLRRPGRHMADPTSSRCPWLG